jgi:hypothetical protein
MGAVRGLIGSRDLGQVRAFLPGDRVLGIPNSLLNRSPPVRWRRHLLPAAWSSSRPGRISIPPGGQVTVSRLLHARKWTIPVRFRRESGGHGE